MQGPIKKRDAVSRWPRGQWIAIQSNVEGRGCICITPEFQSSLGDAQVVVGESMQERTRRCGLLLPCELIGTHRLMWAR